MTATILTEAISNREMASILKQQPPHQPRVRFSDCILILCFTKPETEDLPQLYYSAHELQKIIDEYIVEQRLAAAALLCPASTENSTTMQPAP